MLLLRRALPTNLTACVRRCARASRLGDALRLQVSVLERAAETAAAQRAEVLLQLGAAERESTGLRNSLREKDSLLTAARAKCEHLDCANRGYSSELTAARHGAWQTERTLRELLESVAQLHRRELGARKEAAAARAEARRALGSLEHHLGGIVLAHIDSPLSWLRGARELRAECRRLRDAGTDVGSPSPSEPSVRLPRRSGQRVSAIDT